MSGGRGDVSARQAVRDGRGGKQSPTPRCLHPGRVCVGVGGSRSARRQSKHSAPCSVPWLHPPPSLTTPPGPAPTGADLLRHLVLQLKGVLDPILIRHLHQEQSTIPTLTKLRARESRRETHGRRWGQQATCGSCRQWGMQAGGQAAVCAGRPAGGRARTQAGAQAGRRAGTQAGARAGAAHPGGWTDLARGNKGLHGLLVVLQHIE